MQIDPDNFLSYSVWLSLPMATRYQIADLFGVKVRGTRETYLGHNDARVISDGFIHSDLAVITKEKMREMTGIKSDDFYVLFKALVNKVEGNQTTLNDVQQTEPTQKDSSGPEAGPTGSRKTGGRKAKGKTA